MIFVLTELENEEPKRWLSDQFYLGVCCYFLGLVWRRLMTNCLKHHAVKMQNIGIHTLRLNVLHQNCIIYINLSPSSAAHMCQWTKFALAQVMACRLFCAKPLPEPMLDYCQLAPMNKINEILIKVHNFLFTKTHIKHRVRNDDPFVQGEISKYKRDTPVFNALKSCGVYTQCCSRLSLALI